VAHLPEAAALEERQVARLERLGAIVPAAGKRWVGVGGPVEVDDEVGPELWRVGVFGAARVDKRGRTSHEHCRVLARVQELHAQLRALPANTHQMFGVDARDVPFVDGDFAVRGFAVQSASGGDVGRVLAHALQEDTTEWFELVGVKAFDGCNHLS
jgi:hypothetical protein